MKKLLFLIMTLAAVYCVSGQTGHPNHPGQTMEKQPFIAGRVSKTATIVLQGPVGTVFPLFGAFEEKKWAEGWNPIPVYPLSEKMEEGIVFRTAGHVPGETNIIWTVSAYQPDHHRVQYTVIAPGRLLTITVVCSAASPHTTAATVTYTFTGLDEAGNGMSKHLLAKMYARDLRDWEEAINKYLPHQ